MYIFVSFLKSDNETHSSTLCIVLFTNPNSRQGEIFFINLASEVPPVVENFVLIFVIFLISTLLSIYKLYLSGVLVDAARSSTKITSMVFIILIGATFFSLVFRGLGGDETIEHFLTSLPGGTFSAILIVMISMFLLGFFLDFIEITFVVVPIVAPIILQMGIDPVWLGVMMAINLQTSFLTPPFGFALFYLRGVAPDSVKTSDIYKGVIPFILIQMIMLILLSVFPGVATWLPSYIFN